MDVELAYYEKNKETTALGMKIAREINYSPDGSTGFLTVADACEIVTALGEHFMETDEEDMIATLRSCLGNMQEWYPFLEEGEDGKD